MDKKARLDMNQATRLARDYQHLVGRTFHLRGADFKLNRIEIGETTSGGYIPVLYFDEYRGFIFYIQIDEFFHEIGASFSIDDYIN